MQCPSAAEGARWPQNRHILKAMCTTKVHSYDTEYHSLCWTGRNSSNFNIRWQHQPEPNQTEPHTQIRATYVLRRTCGFNRMRASDSVFPHASQCFFWANRFLFLVFPKFSVSLPCTRLSWPFRQLLSAHKYKYIVSYRILYSLQLVILLIWTYISSFSCFPVMLSQYQCFFSRPFHFSHSFYIVD